MLDVKQAKKNYPIDKKDYLTDCSITPLKRNPYHKETSQLIRIVNYLTGFQAMRATTEGIYVGNQTN